MPLPALAPERPNQTFVVTDDQNNILGLPAAGPFDFDGAGPGTCLIWHLAYQDGLGGLAMDLNTADLVGTYDFSNPITVVRQAPDGGRVTTASGDTTFTAEAGNVLVPVMHTTTATELSFWYIITDDNNSILGFANSAATDTLDLSSAPAGTCRIWGWSYRGRPDPVVGDDISTLDDDACEALSANFVEVERTATTSTRPPLDADQVSLFPNPAPDVLFLDLARLTQGLTSIEVFDVTGRLVHQQQLRAANGRQRIELADLPGGTYLLRVTNDRKVLTRRFVH